MAIRRAMAAVVALVFTATFAVAQQAPKPDNKKRSKAEQQEIETLVKTVDGVMAGQPAPSDVTMTIEPFFMKSQEQRTFVPFVAGAASMSAPKFLSYNVIGGVAWTAVCVGAGFLFGNVPVVKNNFSIVALGIVAVSFIPLALELLKHRGSRVS